MKKVLAINLLLGLFLLVLSACAPLTQAAGTLPTEVIPATPQSELPITTTRDAQVISVEVQAQQGDPNQVAAIVKGKLSDSCSTLQSPQVSFTSGNFNINLTVVSPIDHGCIQIITPFDQTIALDTGNLAPGTYAVNANGVSTSFNFPLEIAQPPSSLKLVVQATDGSFQVVNLDTPLNPTARPTFNNFLPYGGGAVGSAYVLDPNQLKAFVTDGNGFRDLVFVQSPTPYGLAVWPGEGSAQARLAWATQNIGGDASSTIKVSNLDGTQFDTVLTQEATNPPVQLVAEFWSADGQWLYFSKEPVGLGGYILFNGGSSLYKINVSTKEIIDVIPTDLSKEPVACLDAISADFRYVADHCLQNAISVRDLVNGTSSPIQPPAEASGYRVAGSSRFSPSGNHLAYALAKGEQDKEQGWVAITSLNGGSKVILTSQSGSYFTVAGWLDDQTLLVQATNLLDCSPFCKSELWTVKIDGSEAQKVADGSFLAVIPNDAIIQLPAGPTTTPLSTACTDAAEYIGDDGLDDTTYAPNTAFTKTWTVKNTGTCTWDSRYMVYQVSGVYMTQQPGYWIVPQGQTVAPGQAVDI
ncbi:MAG TPA: NBR1-Ig-like domain-containing protein, partial [Anaerolineales bacterium]